MYGTFCYWCIKLFCNILCDFCNSVGYKICNPENTNCKNTKEANLDGVVCSPLEAKIIKENCGEDFLTVTPGIRFADDAKGDQKRVTTPLMAKEIGSSYIVVGRSITGAKDPVASYRRCVKEFVGE